MKKVTLQVMIITAISKLLGFIREVALSYVYGASIVTDAYLVSQTIPRVIFAFISSGTATGFIPMYSRILNEHGKERADSYTSNLCNILLGFATVLVVLVLLTTKPLVKVFAPGFADDALVHAIRFTRISVFGVYFTGLVTIFTGYLRLQGNFIVPSLVGLPLNFVVIGALFVSAKTSVYILAVGTIVAAASELLLCAPFVRKYNYNHIAVLDLKDRDIQAMVSMVVPVVLGTAVNDINVLVDRSLASAIAVGGISALNYANRLNGFVQSLFVVSIATVMYPIVSKMAAKGNIKGLKVHLSEVVSLVGLLVIPATVGLMIFSREIVLLLFGRGAFTQDAAAMTSNALFYYSMGMVAYSLRYVFARVFYSLQDTRTPMINATIAVVMNIVLNIVLSSFIGIGGLALATSIAATVSACLMLVTLRRKIGPLGLKGISISFAKISIASLLMGCVAYYSQRILSRFVSGNVALIAAIGIGVLTYGVMLFFMRIPEVDRTVKQLRHNIKKSKAVIR